MHIYLTGDRQMPAPAAVLAGVAVINSILEQHGPNVTFHTGTAELGFERAVRYLLPSVTIHEYPTAENGKLDFEPTFKRLAEADSIDQIIVVHADPLDSRILKSINQFFPEEKVWLAGHFA